MEGTKKRRCGGLFHKPPFPGIAKAAMRSMLRKQNRSF